MTVKMRKVLFVLLSVVTLCSCVRHRVWNDTHIPTHYYDGVFSFDYEGTRYYQYSYRVEYGGPFVYCAIALYHPQRDTLIIYGAVGGDDIHSLLFTIPFEQVISTGKPISLSGENIMMWSRNLTAKEVLLQFDSFFDPDEYISGSFSVVVEDHEHGQSKIENGLFRMNAKPNESRFYERDYKGNRVYVGPNGISEDGGIW